MLLKDGKSNGEVTVREQKDSVLLKVRPSGSTLDTDANLTLPQARYLAMHLNKICERIRNRPKHRG